MRRFAPTFGAHGRADIWRVVRPSRRLPYIKYVSGKGREPLSVTMFVHLHAHTHSSACRHMSTTTRTRMDTQTAERDCKRRTSQHSCTRPRTRAHMIARMQLPQRLRWWRWSQRPAGTRGRTSTHKDPHSDTTQHDTHDNSGRLRPRRHAPSPSPYTLPSPRRRVELPGVFLPLGRLTRR